jgi:hypothetical protein
MSCAFLQRRRARATSRRCRSAACRAFFKGEITSLEEPPNRSAAAGDSSLTHRGNDLVKRQIRPRGDQGQQPFRVRLQRRFAPSARLRFGASSIVPAPPPSHRRAWAQPEVLGRLRRDAPDSTASITRSRRSSEYGFGIDRAPQNRNQCLQTRAPIDIWESPIQTRRNLL